MSISNATRELVQAIFDNDPHRVSTRSRRGVVNACCGLSRELMRIFSRSTRTFFILKSRRVERDFRLIVELNDRWPALMEWCIDLPWHSLPLTRLD